MPGKFDWIEKSDKIVFHLILRLGLNWYFFLVFWFYNLGFFLDNILGLFIMLQIWYEISTFLAHRLWACVIIYPHNQVLKPTFYWTANMISIAWKIWLFFKGKVTKNKTNDVKNHDIVYQWITPWGIIGHIVGYCSKSLQNNTLHTWMTTVLETNVLCTVQLLVDVPEHVLEKIILVRRSLMWINGNTRLQVPKTTWVYGCSGTKGSYKITRKRPFNTKKRPL